MKHISQFKLWPKVAQKELPLARLRRLTRAEIAKDPGSVIPSRENLAKLFNDLNQS